ncbi:tetratricopeptide repeat protein [uncultured Helicobacter sp.]|uniref:tetratricopeptide repeat protein n=3 Tax=uncultured Helicobacter sp. TaxID=175537 RepID=UPI00374F6DB6
MRKLLYIMSVCVGLIYADTSVSVLDATIKDKAIGGVEVTFQKEGQSSIKTKTDSKGVATLPTPFGDDSANVIMILKKDGYASMAVKCPCDGFVYAMSPVLENLDSLRVVLQWDDQPKDMDLHAYFENNHIYFSDRHGDKAYLDVDDVDGFGPETITIKKRKNGQKYVFFVHNFSSWAKEIRDADGKYTLPLDKLKNVKVYVYIGSSLVRTYTMPKIPNGLENARIWVPFYIDEEGKIIDKNIIIDDGNPASGDSFGPDLEKIIAKNFNLSYAHLVSQADKKRAKNLNNQGEKAYHAKDYERAISLYMDSIDLNPNDGQTYSNLGLAYQKAGKLAEANWANRKAIELASGANANVIKASSYYNIARIYEEKGEYESALQNFQNAQAHKKNEVYTNAIRRMEEKLR